jgi:hypothetical protein
MQGRQKCFLKLLNKIYSLYVIQIYFMKTGMWCQIQRDTVCRTQDNHIVHAVAFPFSSLPPSQKPITGWRLYQCNMATLERFLTVIVKLFAVCDVPYPRFTKVIKHFAPSFPLNQSATVTRRPSNEVVRSITKQPA